VTAGTLCVNGSLAGGGPVNLLGGTVLTGSGSIAGNVTATSATIVQDAGGYIAGSVTLNSGTLTVGQAGSGGCLNVGGGVYINGSSAVVAGNTTAALSGNLDFTSSSNATFSGEIIGPASSVTLNSPAGAVLTLAGSNQYGGGTFVHGGTLKAANSAALALGNLTMTAGTVDLGGLPLLEIASLAGSGGVVTESASGVCTLLVGAGSGPAAPFCGAITDGEGVLGLVLEDAAGGDLVLAGADSYTGGTTVLDGTLVIASTCPFPAGGGVVIGNGGAFASEDVLAVQAEVSRPLAAATAVPEPGSLAIFFVGFAALVILRTSRYDPIHLVWMVKKAGKLTRNANRPRPHPARLDGESGCPAKDRRINSCRTVAFRSAKVAFFRGAKGDTCFRAGPNPRSRHSRATFFTIHTRWMGPCAFLSSALAVQPGSPSGRAGWGPRRRKA
jgi:autotransporter-associated beta strand protein